MKSHPLVSAAVLLALAGCAAQTPTTPSASATSAPLIPRDTIFGNPERSGGQVSPDGKYLSFLAPRDGVLNVWVVERGRPLAQARPLTNEKTRPIRNYSWAANASDIVYTQDKGGDENFLLYAVNAATGAERTLTDYKGVRVLVYGSSLKRPDEVVIGINDRDKAWHDPYLLNIRTGEKKKLLDNTERYSRFILDDDLNVRFVTRSTKDGGFDVLRWKDGKAEPFDTIGFEDSQTAGPRRITRDGRTLYWDESRGRNTAALLAIDLATGQKRVVAEDARADVGAPHLGPRDRPHARLQRELPQERMAGDRPGDPGRHRLPEREPEGPVERAEPDARRPGMARGQRPGDLAGARGRLRPQGEEPVAALHRPPEAGGNAAARDVPGGDQVARRAHARLVPDAAGG
jgi:hypothetical protein